MESALTEETAQQLITAINVLATVMEALGRTLILTMCTAVGASCTWAFIRGFKSGG